MEILFNGKKNEQPIKCTSLLQFSWLIRLEQDDTVTSYFDPRMTMSAPFDGTKHMLPIDIWAIRTEEASSLIAFIDPATEQLFNDEPGVLESLKAHCRALKCEYVPILHSFTEYIGVEASE